MLHDVILTLYVFMWFALVGSAILFVVSGLDDLFIDIWYWVRYPYRAWKMRQYVPLQYETLLETPEKPIAVLIPCWGEANVIGSMLRHNTHAIDYTNYIFFVGVYPNDLDTIAEVRAAMAGNSHIQCVIGKQPGPTNKAANLNQIYQAIKQYETTQEEPFQMIVFHDSEDVIHPLSFKLYNHIIPRKDMIQLPVFPMVAPLYQFTHWLYADEFAENHTKNITVRESMGCHIPSAGVGTAFARRVIEVLEKDNDGKPFSETSVTEDYRTSLIVRQYGFKQIFLTHAIRRTVWKRKGWLKPRYVECKVKERVATRAMFPEEYIKAVRQKTRWIIGIVFQEWEHTPWPGAWRLRYSVMHDRKAFMTHFINGAGYLIFLFWLFYRWYTDSDPSYPSLQEQINFEPWVWQLIVITSFIMFARLVQRFIATYRVYGVLPAMLAIPRACYGNFLNMHAVLRAYGIYFMASGKKKRKKPVAWDKTEHTFPGRHLLVPYRKRLGDLLLESNHITVEHLQSAVIEQQKTGERLGEILVRLGLISSETLLTLIARQYALRIFPYSQYKPIPEELQSKSILKKLRWLKRLPVLALAIEEGQLIKIGIDDPTNELLLRKISRKMAPLQVQFMLIQRNV